MAATIFLTLVALFIVVALLEGWDFSDLLGCFAGNKTLCFAVVTAVAAVKVGGEAVGMLMLFVLRSLYLLVLLFVLIMCSSSLKRTIRHIWRTAIEWILWIHQMVCLVKCYVDVVTSVMGLLGALMVLKAVMLRDAPNGVEVMALKALKDLFGSVSILLKSSWKLNLNAR